MKNKIFFQLWNPTGMINQVMSMEIAVGLAHQTGKHVVVHYISTEGDKLYDFKQVPIYTPSTLYNEQRELFIKHDKFPHLKDILEWDANITLIDEKISFFPEQEEEIRDTTFKYYYADLNKEITEDELFFAQGRERLDFSKTLHLKETLGWYSRFFYDRDQSLDNALNKVRFKKVYTDFADKIVESLGEFQGGHIRLSDHAIKMFSTTQEMFENGLDKFEKNKLPIIISTCEPGNKMIIKNKHRFILLDEYIVNHFAKEFYELPFQDEVVFGLICNLVMQKAKYFIGTSGSTYTGYIHRKRNELGLNETWDFFDEPKYEQNGPYSWNGSFLEEGQKNWWREWKESKLKL